MISCKTLCIPLIGLLASCATVGPQHQLPAQAKINATGAQQAFQGSQPDLVGEGELPPNWWHLYDDPRLNQLIEAALAENSDLKIAAAKLARVEAIAMEAEGAKDIRAGASVGAARAQVSGESYLLEKKVPVLNLADAGIRVGYQLDLVGGLQRAIEAAEADVEAGHAALHLARISIVSETAAAYMEACAAGHELEVAQHQLELQKKHSDVVHRLVQQGRGMAVDLPRAKGQVEQIRTHLPVYREQQRTALYKLAVLTGKTPGEYPRDVESCQHLPQLQQAIPVGDGAALLKITDCP